MAQLCLCLRWFSTYINFPTVTPSSSLCLSAACFQISQSSNPSVHNSFRASVPLHSVSASLQGPVTRNNATVGAQVPVCLFGGVAPRCINKIPCSSWMHSRQGCSVAVCLVNVCESPMRWSSRLYHRCLTCTWCRWNARANSVPVELVYVWVTTARASPKLLNYARQQHDLIVVHHDMIMRMCPLLAIAPELYSVKPLAPVESGLQQVKASQSSKQIYCALPRTQARAYRHSVPCMQVNKRHITHKTTSLACNAGCTLQCFA